MDEFLGLLKEEEEEQGGKKLDEIVDFKKVFPKKVWLGTSLELVDGKFFIYAIKTLDDKVADKMPETFKPSARKVLLAIINEDWETVSNTAPALLNLLIDIPKVDEDTELAVLTGICMLVFLASRAYANKKLMERDTDNQ